MTTIDIMGIVAAVILAAILLMCAIVEFVSYRRIRKSWDIIQHNLMKHGVQLKKVHKVRFVFTNGERISRDLYPSEVMLFWRKCEYGEKFEEHTVPLSDKPVMSDLFTVR